MLAGVSVVLILLSLSLVPVKISFLLNGDFARFIGTYRIALLLGLVVYEGKFFIGEDNGIKSLCLKHGKKEYSIHLTMDKSDAYSFASFLTSDFIPPMESCALEVCVCAGVASDAFASAILAASVKSLVCSITAMISAVWNVSIGGNVTASFSTRDVLSARLRAYIGVSFADLTYILIKFFINKLSKNVFSLKKKRRRENV